MYFEFADDALYLESSTFVVSHKGFWIRRIEKKAIFSIVEGENYIQPSLIPSLNSKMIEKNRDEGKIESLTKRELEVLKLLAVGMYNKEVAEKLNISERTVKNHVSNIFKKIEVTDRTQAAVFAIRNNLIEL